MASNYYNRKYEINSKVRDMIEKKLGKKVDLSYMQIENIISIVYKSEYKKLISPFTENDKRKVISYLKERSPNTFNSDVCENVNLFLKDNFTEDEIISYIEYCINKYYHPGELYHGIKINNDGLIELIDHTNLYKMSDGIIINKRYINDLIYFFNNELTEYNYDNNTLLIDEDLTDDMVKLYDEIKSDNDINYYSNDKIFIITSNDEKSTNFLKEKFDGLRIQKVLDFSYYDKKEEVEEVSDTMDLGNGIVMKGDFTNIGKIGGTQIIGVGSSTGNDVLDELIKDDAMDMITRIMNGDMSRCGKDEDDEDNKETK